MKIDPKLTAIVEGYFPSPVSNGQVAGDLAPQLRMVEINDLKTGVQPRTDFDAVELKNLQNSISALARAGQGIAGSGILQPLLVRPLENGTLQVVAGERRLRAAKAAGAKLIPVVIGESLDEQQAFGQAIIENLLRSDLSPLEEARALDKWMKEAQLSLRLAAEKLGRDKGYLENRLRLLLMKEDVQNMVSSRKDTLPHARLINAVEDDDRRAELIEMVVAHGASKREIENIIASYEIKSVSSEKTMDDIVQVNKERKSGERKPAQRELKDALKSLQNASKELGIDEANQLADKLEKLVARLRKTARLMR